MAPTAYNPLNPSIRLADMAAVAAFVCGSQHRISRSQKRQTPVFPPANATTARRLRLFPPPITAEKFR